MIRLRGLMRAACGGAVTLALLGVSARAQQPELPAAPKGAPQDSGALRVQVQGTLTDAQKNDVGLENKTKEVASELSQQMRTVVKEQLAAGKSEQEVKDYFISKYGEWILLQPQAHGFNLVVYALPIVLVLGGAGLIVLLVRRWTAVPATAGPGTDDVS